MTVWPSRLARALRAVSGLLAGGLVALAVGLTVAWFVASSMGTPGPGPLTLLWHLAAAVVAVLAQRHADRHADAGGTVAAVGVVGVTAAVVVIQWLGAP